MSDTPKELDWVNVRASCSLLSMFRSLEVAVITDVEAAQSLPGGNPDRFKFQSHSGKSFSVTRMLDHSVPIGDAVVFSCEKDAIHVQWREYSSTTPMFTATVTLDNDGNCKFRVGDQSLEQWQVRRMALEKLLFG